MHNTQLKQLMKQWPPISKLVLVPQTKADYERVVQFLDELIDEVGEEETHPLGSLMETIGALVELYEITHYPEPQGDPVQSLMELMKEHDLTQSDLPEIGSQGVVSEILRRKRTLNTRQIKALSKRFHVSPAVFL